MFAVVLTARQRWNIHCGHLKVVLASGSFELK